MIANAVNVDAPGIRRTPAVELDEASDLGERLVTVGVPELSSTDRAAALEAGVREAGRLVDAEVIHSAALCLQGQWRIVGNAAYWAAEVHLPGQVS